VSLAALLSGMDLLLFLTYLPPIVGVFSTLIFYNLHYIRYLKDYAMKEIFINLPVEDVDKSMEFYTRLGFTSYPLFTGADQKCVRWGEQIYLMLQTKEFFMSGNTKPLTNTRYRLAATFTLPVESLVRVNEIIEIGLEAGGSEPMPLRDEGFMHVRGLEDPDGHTWSIIYLDINKFRELKFR
jgi:predicted lactoylglutathione lyase